MQLLFPALLLQREGQAPVLVAQVGDGHVTQPLACSELRHHHQVRAHAERVQDARVQRCQRERRSRQRRRRVRFGLEVLAHALDGIIIEQPQHDAHVRVHLAGVQRHVEVGEVVVRRADDGRRVLQVDVLERRRVANVFNQHRHALRPKLPGGLRVVFHVYDEHGVLQLTQLLGDAVPDAARSADDDVVAKALGDHFDPLLLGFVLGEKQVPEAHAAIDDGGDAQRGNDEVQNLDQRNVDVVERRLPEEQEVDVVQRTAEGDAGAVGQHVEAAVDERQHHEEQHQEGAGDTKALRQGDE